jgi:ketosteroid isomerase-like protein
MSDIVSVETVRTAYAALLGGDISMGAAMLDDSSVLHLPGRSGFAGDYQGREAIVGVLARMTQLSGESLEFDSFGLLVAEESVLLLSGHVDGSRDGVRLDTDVIHALSVKGGKIREAWIFSLGQSNFNDFWTGA